jgi:2-C-methyl-D-erythritol 4-phosphate cytidylyltransferase
LKKSAIIVAGGSGVRMGSDVPKQFLLLNDIPVLIRTLQLFHAVADEVVLVLPQAHFDYWEQLRSQFNINKSDYQLVVRRFIPNGIGHKRIGKGERSGFGCHP